MYIYKPELNESFPDFFRRVYENIKKESTTPYFWMIEQFGRRASFIAGKRSIDSLSSAKVNIGKNYTLFFDKTCPENDREEIVTYFKSILKQYYGC